MPRLLHVLVLPLLFVALPAAPAAPVPKHLMKPGPELYYPTRVGTKWVYLEDNSTEWNVITHAEVKNGAFHIRETHTRKSDSAKLIRSIAVSENGVYRRGVNNSPDDPPECWLTLPLKRGEEWSYGDDRFTAREPENVETPAGKFRAIPVIRLAADSRVVGLGLPRGSYTRWFAPGVGLVRQRSGERDHYRLKSFTPVKD